MRQVIEVIGAEINNSFKASLKDGTGFSFKSGYNKGEHQQFLINVDLKNGKNETLLTFSGDSDSVKVQGVYKANEMYGSIYYRLKIINFGDTPVRISEAFPVDLLLSQQNIGDIRIHTFRGGMTEWFYPPKAFTTEEITMHPGAEYPCPNTSCSYEIGSKEGRSSDDYMPFVILENNAKTSGMYIGIGWSGDWRLRFEKESCSSNFRIYGGMSNFDMLLKAGEEIELPEVLVGFYEGDFFNGCNNLRRYINGEIISKFPLNKQTPPVSYDHWFGLGNDINEELLKRQVDNIHGLGIEYFVVDAGWYKNDKKGFNGFHTGVGNFTIVDDKKFPNGLKPLADYVRSKGMKFGLWFDPERAYKDSIIAKELPECMLKRDDPFSTLNKDYYLVDFGRREVIDYTKGYLKRYIEELGIEWIRWDFNIRPRKYWLAKDSPDRRGETEIGHIKGLYDMLEWINSEYPQVLIEGCSGGGNRIDLRMMKLCQTFWASDQSYHIHSIRSHLSAGNLILPGIYLNRGLALRTLYTPQIYDYPDSYFQSLFGGSYQIGDPVQDWSDKQKERCAAHIQVYKKIRDFINKEYYHLFPMPCGLEFWDGWEFYDPKKDEGFVQVFRVESPDEIKLVKMRGVCKGKVYRFTDPYSNEEFCMDGNHILDVGLEFRLGRNEAKTLIFKSRG